LSSVLASPAAASVSLKDYVRARAAQMQGDEARSARLFASIAEANPEDRTIVRRAIATAIQSGQAELAIKLARRVPLAELPVDARLMLAADDLRRGNTGNAVAALARGATSTEAELLAPLVRAWEQTERRSPAGAAAMAALAEDSPLKPVADEHRAAMLFALGRADEALPIAQAVVAREGGRNSRLRIAYADSLIRLNRRADAIAILQGGEQSLATARTRLAAGRPLNAAIATPAAGFAEMLNAMAVDLSRDDGKALPIALAQVSRYADPASHESTILLALLQNGDDRDEDALATLRGIGRDDLLAGEALDIEARILTERKQFGPALSRAMSAANAAKASGQDFARLANVYGEMERHSEAAVAYAQAIARSGNGATTEAVWTLHLLRAASLEQAGQWDAAKVELNRAIALEPDNPLLLNFLGYGKLERGEDLDAAEAMIRKASALRPNDASITDSLGWALYKRGRLPEAIETLGRAAAGDPSQAEIHEHLGDALYSSGRRIEARFSWRAALINAEDKAKSRLEGKIESGLNPANAAP
jgi:Flp pilus assembly protein TadD